MADRTTPRWTKALRGASDRDAQRNGDVRFESASIRERALVTRPKTSVVTPAAPSLLRMPSSSAACSCSNWSFHCNRIASFCSAVSSVDSLNASGVSKTLAGFFMALSMSMQSFDAVQCRSSSRAAIASAQQLRAGLSSCHLPETPRSAQRFEIDAQRSHLAGRRLTTLARPAGWPNSSW